MTEPLVRSAELDASEPEGGDGRTVDVRLLAWDTPAQVTDDGRHRYEETFARGSIELPSNGRVPVFSRHAPRPDGSIARGELIGHLEQVDSRPDAPYARARIADTAAGRDTLALIREGTIGHVSIEFDPLETNATATGVTRARARLVAMAFANVPQYETAEVLSVRSHEETTAMTHIPPTMPAAAGGAPLDPPSPPVAVPAEVAAGDQEQARARAHAETLSALAGPEAVPAAAAAPPPLARVSSELVSPVIRSLGEYVQGLARGDVEALETGRRLARALATSLTTDNTGVVRDAWINEVLGLVGAGRPFIGAWRTAPLPDSGMNVNYPRVASNVTIGEQDLELEEVASSSFQIDPDTWPVETFAGGERMSLQLALRSDPSYVEALWRAFALEYAVQTDKNAIAKAFAEVTAAAVVSADTAAAWYAAIVEACRKVWKGALMQATAIVMSVECWEVVAGFVDGDGRPIFPVGVNNPSNAAGQTSVAGDTTQIGGLSWIVDPNMTSRQAMVGTREAFVHLESSGAPIRLEQPAISVLGRDAAVYGFVSEVIAYPAGMCEVTPPAGAPA